MGSREWIFASSAEWNRQRDFNLCPISSVHGIAKMRRIDSLDHFGIILTTDGGNAILRGANAPAGSEVKKNREIRQNISINGTGYARYIMVERCNNFQKYIIYDQNRGTMTHLKSLFNHSQ